MKDKSIGQKIKQLRLKKGLTQYQLAEKLHMSDKNISKWENDKSIPDIETLRYIANFFEVKTNYLIDDKGIKNKLIIKVIKLYKFIKKNKYKFISFILFIAFLIYFLLTHNSTKIYDLVLEDKNISITNGYLYISKNRKILSINGIKIKDPDAKNIKYRLYVEDNGKKYLVETNNENSILIDEDEEKYLTKEIINKITKNLFIEYEYLDKNNNIQVKSKKIIVTKTSTNEINNDILDINELDYYDKKYDLSNYNKKSTNVYEKMNNNITYTINTKMNNFQIKVDNNKINILVNCNKNKHIYYMVRDKNEKLEFVCSYEINNILDSEKNLHNIKCTKYYNKIYQAFSSCIKEINKISK